MSSDEGFPQEESGSTPAEESGPGETSMNIGGNGAAEIPTPNSVPPTERRQTSQVIINEDQVALTQQPRQPDMALVQRRIDSFQNWPHEVTHPAERMAAAGFYYTGYDDCVRCFHCGEGLKAWMKCDEPWEEHIHRFPHCPFVRMSAGQNSQVPRRPDMARYEARTSTNARLPEKKTETPEKIAKASFHYTAQVVCSEDGFGLNSPVAKSGSEGETRAVTKMEDTPTAGATVPVNEQAQLVWSEDGLCLHCPPRAESGSEGETRAVSMMDDAPTPGATVPSFEYSEGGLVLTRSSPYNEQGSKCVHCMVKEREVLQTCGHKMLCLHCFGCQKFWERHLDHHTDVTCLACGWRRIGFYVPDVQRLAQAHVSMQRRQREASCTCYTRCG